MSNTPTGKTADELMKPIAERVLRIEARMKMVAWLGEEWQHFRLIQEAALAGEPVVIHDDMDRQYYLSKGGVLARVRKAEKLGLVEVISTPDEGYAYQITGDAESVAAQLVKALFA